MGTRGGHYEDLFSKIILRNVGRYYDDPRESSTLYYTFMNKYELTVLLGGILPNRSEKFNPKNFSTSILRVVRQFIYLGNVNYLLN